MTYHFERAGDSGNWFEFRDNGAIVEFRDRYVKDWALWSNTQTLEQATAYYRNSTDWVATRVFDAVTPLYAGTQMKSDPIVAIDHKCVCPWDGPTGVYAKGCSCGGV